MPSSLRWTYSGILIVLLALASSQWLDQHATKQAQTLFNKALVTYGITRTLNGVISVAQGTEVALQPAGVGLTISAGEILDPLNDLVERFSWLVLAACASLGVQLLLTEIFSNLWVTGLLAATVAIALLGLWQPRLPGGLALLKLSLVVLFLRFVFTGVTLLGALLTDAFLLERQEQALASISQVSDSLQTSEQTIEQTSVRDNADSSVLQRLDEFFTGQRQKFDVEARLQRMAEQAETAIAALVSLMVVFVMQTIVLPIGLLMAGLAAFKWFWRLAPDSLTRANSA